MTGDRRHSDDQEGKQVNALRGRGETPCVRNQCGGSLSWTVGQPKVRSNYTSRPRRSVFELDVVLRLSVDTVNRAPVGGAPAALALIMIKVDRGNR